MILSLPALDEDFIEALRTKLFHKLAPDGAERSLPSGTHTIVRKAMEDLVLLAHPIMASAVFPVLEVTKGGITTEAGDIESARLAGLAKRCDGQCFIIFMVSTMGKSFMESAAEINSLYHSFVYDIIASQCVELATDVLEIKLKNDLDCNKEKEFSMRSSPGYCDWNISGQRILFKAVDARKIDVQLNPSLMMVPRKSISAVTLMADRVPLRNSCCLCAMKDCRWRRAEAAVS